MSNIAQSVLGTMVLGRDRLAVVPGTYTPTVFGPFIYSDTGGSETETSVEQIEGSGENTEENETQA